MSKRKSNEQQQDRYWKSRQQKGDLFEAGNSFRVPQDKIKLKQLAEAFYNEHKKERQCRKSWHQIPVVPVGPKNKSKTGHPSVIEGNLTYSLLMYYQDVIKLQGLK